MKNYFKKLASKLPVRWQQEMKRLHFGRSIKKGSFITDEPEYSKLEEWVNPGDLVLDIGANVGHYTQKLSLLVGTEGRVIAFEPVPDTFELLTANVARFVNKNISLLNMAASDSTKFLGMDIPEFDTGLTNYYMAKLSNDQKQFSVLCMPIDTLDISDKVALAKIDVEGHEEAVLVGMKEILKRDHPVLIVEGEVKEVEDFLNGLGYTFEKIDGSPNRIYKYLSTV